MSKKLLTIFVFALSGSALAGSAKYILADTVHESPVSGEAANLPMHVGQDGSYQALWSASFYEDGDSPCKVDIGTRHLNNATQLSTSGKTGDCDSPGSKQTLSFTDENTYVRGVAVCLNKKENAIKGVRLYGTSLNKTTGALTAKQSYKGFERPRCKKWKLPKFCGADQVATGLVVHDSFHRITALSLDCQKVLTK